MLSILPRENWPLGLRTAARPGGPLFLGPSYAKRGESGAVTRFRLHLDSDSQPCSNLQLELSYDFEGDHNIDRKEVYKPFSTDGQDGWQEFSEEIGLLEATGEMRDFEGGQLTQPSGMPRLTCRSWKGSRILIHPTP